MSSAHKRARLASLLDEGLILASYVRHIWEENEYLRRNFDFPIPDCCAPVYVSKAKQTTRRRGRSAKPKVEKQTL